MKLKAYLHTLPLADRREFWSRVGHRKYINAIANGKRAPSIELAKKIEQESGGAVPRWELRPDVWDRPPRAKRTSTTAPA